MTVLNFKIVFDDNGNNEECQFRVAVNEDIDAHQLYDYFERFALAAGFALENIKNAILDRAAELNHD